MLVPLRYLLIQHPEKATYDVLLPALTTGVLWTLYRWLVPSMAIFGDNGLLRFERDLLVMAVPFLVGALAAVAMAGTSSSLDRRPPGPHLALDGKPLTLRQFVCYLLGYLAFLSFVTLLGATAAQLLRDPVLALLVGHTRIQAALHDIGSLVDFGLANYIVITTLWALYFLTDVVNRPTDQ